MPALMPLVLVSLLAAAPQQAPPVPETVAIPDPGSADSGANRGNHDAFWASQPYSGWMAGASTPPPHRPNTTEGTAASRSMM